MRLALYQPEIPQNTGTLIRLAACMGVPLDIIEPLGFLLTDRKLRRAGMDYLDLAEVKRHSCWEEFLALQNRVVLLESTASIPYTDFTYTCKDTLVVGQESRGFPATLKKEIATQVKIPLVAASRSLNVAVAAAMVLGESLRQTNSFP